MTVEIISWSISAKVWDRTRIELATPGSAARYASVARHVTDCATRPGPHIYLTPKLRTSSYVCKSFTRLAGLLQHPCLKTLVCSLQLHTTTWHVGYNCTRPTCMSVIVASHQQICLKQLQLTCKHICSFWVEPAGVSVTHASDRSYVPYVHTRPTGW